MPDTQSESKQALQAKATPTACKGSSSNQRTASATSQGNIHKKVSTSLLSSLRPYTEFNLCLKDPRGKKIACFDDELARFCMAVRDNGSLYTAAQEADMSYSQAWRKISDLEMGLEADLFIRRGNKGSALSPLGEKLLAAYLSTKESLISEAGSLFFSLQNNRKAE